MIARAATGRNGNRHRLSEGCRGVKCVLTKEGMQSRGGFGENMKSVGENRMCVWIARKRAQAVLGSRVAHKRAL